MPPLLVCIAHFSFIPGAGSHQLWVISDYSTLKMFYLFLLLVPLCDCAHILFKKRLKKKKLLAICTSLHFCDPGLDLSQVSSNKDQTIFFFFWEPACTLQSITLTRYFRFQLLVVHDILWWSVIAFLVCVSIIWDKLYLILFVCFSTLFLLNIREMEKAYSAFDFQVIVPSVLSSSVSVSRLKYRLAVAKNSSKQSNTLNLYPTLDL